MMQDNLKNESKYGNDLELKLELEFNSGNVVPMECISEFSANTDCFDDNGVFVGNPKKYQEEADREMKEELQRRDEYLNKHPFSKFLHFLFNNEKNI